MMFYEVDPETGEPMDEMYHMRHDLAMHTAVWGGVCAACQETFPCAQSKALRDALNARRSQLRTRLLGERVRRPYKRSDVSRAVVLSCVYTLGFTAFEELCKTFPAKVVHAAFLRDMSRGLMECGTTERLPWLTPAGRMWLASHSDATRRGASVTGQDALKSRHEIRRNCDRE